jgi:flagellar biosynthetic protein FliO
MPQQSKWSLKGLLEWFKKLPRWLQYVLGAFLVLLTFLWMLTNPTKSADITDPYGNSFSILIDVILKLGLVVLLIFVVAVAYRRWQPGSMSAKTRKLNLLETMQLGPKRTLYLIKAGDQELLLGATDQSIQLITRVSIPDDVLPPATDHEILNLAESSHAAEVVEPAFSDLLSESIENSSDLDH